jgi:tRNA 2-selenouridine synthase
LRVPFIERVQNIIEEYVLDPLSKGFDFICVKEHLLKSLTRIKKTLGGLVYEKIYSQMNLFSEDCFFKRESHERWVTTLLENYYDKTYEYSFKKQDKNTIFAGSYNECCEFLKERVK